jgi:ATP adenylyltransferase
MGAQPGDRAGRLSKASGSLVRWPPMEQLWAPWRMQYIEAADAAQDECVLCAISELDAARASLVVERSELTYTLLNLFPYSSGHLMVVPYLHVPHLTDLDPAAAAAMMVAAQRALRAVQAAYSPDGFNLGINHGRAAGAGIDTHCHMHVVPRWSGDTNFMPVLASVKVLPEALDHTAQRLREAFAQL